MNDHRRVGHLGGTILLLCSVISIAFLLCLTSCGGGSKENDPWPTAGLGSLLPQPESGEIKVISDSDDRFSASIDEVQQDAYSSYVAACKDAGFTVEAEETSDEFKALSEEGHRLEVRFYDGLDNMDVEVKAPIEDTLNWPTVGLATLIPVPDSATGKIESDSSSSFTAYVCDTPLESYAAYVDKVIAKGFSVDYNRGEKSFGADNKDGVHVNITYEGLSAMRISVTDYDSSSSSTGSPATEAPEQSTPDPAPAEESAQPAAEASGTSSDFRATMDSYEAFFDEYVAFMEQYSANPSSVELLGKYSDMMSQYSDMMAQLEGIDGSSLSAEDYAYYVEVQTRINEKLASVAA